MVMDIKVTTSGDVTGINKIEAAHTSLMSKVKEDFKAIQGKSPMQIAAETMTHERKLGDLDRRARDIERKIMATRIRMSEGTLGTSGKQRVDVLQAKSTRVQLAKSQAMETQRFDVEEKQRRARMVAPFMGAGRKVLGYGSMIAGGLGAYSLMSKVFGEMEGVKERNIAYGTALSVTRGRGGDLDYSPTDQPFFEVRKALKDLDEISVITAKDMAPMLEVAKEIGDVSGKTGANLAQITNLGKFLDVGSQSISQFLTQGIRGGGFEGGTQATDMGKMMLLNQNMMNRATESLQSMQQVMTSTTHGTQGLGAFNMMNLLDTMNTQGFKAYMGMGGANMMTRVDQAFRGGGNENFQYMQTLALNPAFQEQNERRRLAWKETIGGPTDYGTGQYDQIIADVFKDLGAFATPEDVRKQLAQTGFKGASKYVSEKYEDSMDKTNLERTFDIYRSTYGSKNEGQRLFMTAQMAKDMGVGFSDVSVLNLAFKNMEKNPELRKMFMEGAGSNEELIKRQKAWEKSGKSIPKYQEIMEERAAAESLAIETATQFQATKEQFMKAFADPAVKDAIVNIAKHLPAVAGAIIQYFPPFIDTLTRHFGTDEEKEALKQKELKEEYKVKLKGMGIDIDKPGAEIQKERLVAKKLLFDEDILLPESRVPISEGGTKEERYTKKQLKQMYTREQIDVPDIFGANKMLEGLVDRIGIVMANAIGADKTASPKELQEISNAISNGFQGVTVNTPPGVTPVD